MAGTPKFHLLSAPNHRLCGTPRGPTVLTVEATTCARCQDALSDISSVEAHLHTLELAQGQAPVEIVALWLGIAVTAAQGEAAVARGRLSSAQESLAKIDALKASDLLAPWKKEA